MRGRRGLIAAVTSTAVAGAIVAGTLVAGFGTGPATVRQAGGGVSAARQERGAQDYIVFYASGRKAEALRAIQAAGGAAGPDNAALGYVVVRQAAATFPEKAGVSPAVVGVTPNRPIGTLAPSSGGSGGSGGSGDGLWASGRSAVHAASLPLTNTKAEPLAGLQWDMKMIGATARGSYAKAPGSKKVLVGIIDTGIDGNHPDIAPNFNRALSRNFVVDLPTDPNGKKVDGPCEYKSCKDPVDVDDDGHGTHVASTIGSPINGLGVAGVAPGVSLVSLRAGQDSGFFFLKPTMDALTYAGDAGIDVVNMSFYIDPWLFNCSRNPSDSRAEQLEQAGIVVGVQRALDYARKRDVTLISAAGNGASDLGKVKSDLTSPDYPADGERARKIDNSCLSVPTESKGVISVSAIGPSKRKSFYSDYGLEQTDLSAPGGDLFDKAGGISGDARQVLAAAPEKALRKQGKLRADGSPKDSSVVRDCQNRVCAYYQYLEGTSMAAPHATGVAAIIISRFGKPGKGGLTMSPAAVEKLLYASAVKTACPTPRAYRYPGNDIQACEGGMSKNGFYGHGIVSAGNAATIKR